VILADKVLTEDIDRPDRVIRTAGPSFYKTALAVVAAPNSYPLLLRTWIVEGQFGCPA
jgi:hypothetical protein